MLALLASAIGMPASASPADDAFAKLASDQFAQIEQGIVDLSAIGTPEAATVLEASDFAPFGSDWVAMVRARAAAPLSTST
jgi:hypothetical protein